MRTKNQPTHSTSKSTSKASQPEFDPKNDPSIKNCWEKLKEKRAEGKFHCHNCDIKNAELDKLRQNVSNLSDQLEIANNLIQDMVLTQSEDKEKEDNEEKEMKSSNTCDKGTNTPNDFQVSDKKTNALKSPSISKYFKTTNDKLPCSSKNNDTVQTVVLSDDSDDAFEIYTKNR